MIVQPQTERKKVDEPRRPTCPTCLERFDAPEPPLGKQRPSGLFAPGDVRQATDGKKPDGVRHAAHKSGLRHWYKITTAIKCSFPDRTPHKVGFIVETLCGRVVNIGKDCGESNIIGFERLAAYAGEQEQRATNLMKARFLPGELAAKAKPISADIERVLKFTDRIAEKLPALAFEMHRRAASGDPLVQVSRVVEHKRKNGSKTRETVIDERRLLGLEAWVGTPPLNLFEASRKMCDEIAAELAEDPDPESEKARRMVRRIDRFDGEMRRAENWLGQARLFFTDQNLSVAVYASKLADSVTIKEGKGRLVFVDPATKRTYSLGLDGLFVE